MASLKSIAQLLRETAYRFHLTSLVVLAKWKPECGCDDPGHYPQCEKCPSLKVFEDLIREKIVDFRHKSEVELLEEIRRLEN